jgi:hypothetical protein
LCRDKASGGAPALKAHASSVYCVQGFQKASAENSAALFPVADFTATLVVSAKRSKACAINELLFDGASPIPINPGGPRFAHVAGIVYPAMQMRGAADNVMLYPAYVDSSLKISTARYVLVEDCDQDRASYSVLNLAISKLFSGGLIQWTETLGAEKDRRSTIAMEGDLWVLRDGHGQVYYTH